jgi:hypothetical protein
MMNTIMAKDEIVGSGHKLMSFIMGKSKTTCPTRTRHKVRSLGGVGFGKYISRRNIFIRETRHAREGRGERGAGEDRSSGLRELFADPSFITALHKHG